MARMVKWGKGWMIRLLEKGETANPYWRPKKGISLVNSELKSQWYEPATKNDIELNYMNLLQLSESELKKLLEDKSKPMLIRILIKNMLSWKWFDIIERMLDRGIGKAKQITETKTIVWFEHNPPEVEDDAEWISQLFSPEKWKAKPPKKKK